MASREWRREDLAPHGTPATDIPGIITCEKVDFTQPGKFEILRGRSKPTYTREEIFGEYCFLGSFIEVPVDVVFEYISNPFSLEEWTVSIREMKHIGSGIYKAREMIVPNSTIYVKIDSYPDSRTVDHICAWDQGDDLWMRYHFRVLDGMTTIGKAGTVLLGPMNARHVYYDRSVPAPRYIEEGRARQDRPWVGDLWFDFYSGHGVECENMKAILEHRWKNASTR